MGAERRSSSRFRYAKKLDVFFDVLAKDRHATAEEIEGRSLKIIEERKGNNSEKRAISLISEFKEVTKVTKANEEDDRKGIDLWVHFENNPEINKLAVPVKSSNQYIKGLIKGNIELANANIQIPIIVLACGEKFPDDEIRQRFHRIVKKITGLSLTRRY